MAQSAKTESVPELRELVKENDRRVFSFISYLVFDPEAAEVAVLNSFSEFGKFYRRSVASRRTQYDSDQLRIRLFQLVWKEAKSLSGAPVPLSLGRDTRLLNEATTDVLAKSPDAEALDERTVERITDRVRTLDFDFRAPLVLRDILKFSDEEATRILGIRWGVYRHRLNRARLDLVDCLRGRVSSVSSLRPASELSL